MTRIAIPLHAAPEVLTDSTRCVLRAHGFRVVDRDGRVLTVEESEHLLNEIGRNGAQALVSLDEEGGTE